ncbi:hypothetical protein POSPLADRAFT_1049737 [Postia placenta MAD-698-R-SB12]|uniref:F-box domain-containing protein n=1 Tax=Postia placenta MAD-698-R-SB12 TaxID=670580 RepID=A0A1X6MNV4_9APHY|nr:hypothetical protein POSPLADRAFT_1049737 [Postia placenta MAD-698-R-SB12]OSX58008.1 hypothetical protein POSPLADRAFT_1049737 [Postia placenta MAD-698-R-SB12]
MCTLATLPQEVLEHVAFYTGTLSFGGPPADVLPLLVANRSFYAALSITSNPHLWTRIFACKFDLSPVLRRLGQENVTPTVVAHEFKRRCEIMKRIRTREGTLANVVDVDHNTVKEMLSTAYVMMLENDGKNERQLREYARIEEWLKQFLCHPDGASLIRQLVIRDRWPDTKDERMILAMWLIWMLLRPVEYMSDENAFHVAIDVVLKLVALGAHQYVLCTPSWTDFLPPYPIETGTSIPYFGTELRLTPPAPAAPAILAYLTLRNLLPVSWDMINYLKRPDPTVPSVAGCTSTEWDAEWARAVHIVGATKLVLPTLPGAFIPGSLEGSWEGLFTYTEFTAYAALLSGASPSVLERSLVAQHPQLWKLREYYLYAEDDEPDSAGECAMSVDARMPLSPGNPLRAYIPANTELRETAEGLEVLEPGRAPQRYESWARASKREGTRRVRDMILKGEGHSAWGQFSLLGRVRPCDGFISLSKDYMNGDRGRWLYRCYMVGNTHGNLSGRWRDTLSPTDVPGYEGCFLMSRRK